MNKYFGFLGIILISVAFAVMVILFEFPTHCSMEAFISAHNTPFQGCVA